MTTKDKKFKEADRREEALDLSLVFRNFFTSHFASGVLLWLAPLCLTRCGSGPSRRPLHLSVFHPVFPLPQTGCHLFFLCSSLFRVGWFCWHGSSESPLERFWLTQINCERNHPTCLAEFIPFAASQQADISDAPKCLLSFSRCFSIICDFWDRYRYELGFEFLWIVRNTKWRDPNSNLPAGANFSTLMLNMLLWRSCQHVQQNWILVFVFVDWRMYWTRSIQLLGQFSVCIFSLILLPNSKTNGRHSPRVYSFIHTSCDLFFCDCWIFCEFCIVFTT